MNLKLTKYFFGILLMTLTTHGAMAGETKCTVALDSTEFNKITEVLSAHDFEDAKKKSLLDSLEKNCFSSIQVSELLGLLEFEEDKISVAKIAHNRVVDPENFDLIFDVFEFESSKKEVMDHIASNK